MARKIVFTSGKGGVGKTTICSGVGKSLAKLGFRVLLVDLDVGLNNLDLEMGIEDKIQYDLLDVLEQRCRPSQAIVQHKVLLLLYILPSVHTFDIGEIRLFDLKNLLESVSQNFDFVLIDCPAGIEMGFHRAVSVASEAVVVTTPHVSAIRNANRILSFLNSFLSDSGLVINRVRKDFLQKKQIPSPEAVAKILDKNLLGVVFESENLCFGGDKLSKTDEDCFETIAKNILNGQSFVLKEER